MCFRATARAYDGSVHTDGSLALTFGFGNQQARGLAIDLDCSDFLTACDPVTDLPDLGDGSIQGIISTFPTGNDLGLLDLMPGQGNSQAAQVRFDDVNGTSCFILFNPGPRVGPGKAGCDEFGPFDNEPTLVTAEAGADDDGDGIPDSWTIEADANDIACLRKAFVPREFVGLINAPFKLKVVKKVK